MSAQGKKERKRPLVDHLTTCQTCLISNKWFCPDAEAMGNKYKEHINSMPANEGNAFHENFINDVIASRVKLWLTGNHDSQIADLKKLFE